MKDHYKIVIAGSGGIGWAAGLILRELGDFTCDLFLGDMDLEKARKESDRIADGSRRTGRVDAFLLPEDGSSPAFDEILRGADILLDCLPGGEAPRMARLARENHLHYVNLTEYVAETQEIEKIAQGAGRGFLLQAGLAPGVINVLAFHLYQAFCRRHEVEVVERIAMRVGALTTTAEPPHYYGFTWSTIGVATEYVKPSIVVRDFESLSVPSLEDVRPLSIRGVLYEEAFTSGGAANLPQALAGKVKNLDYKTLRYPGHYAWARNILAEAPPDADQVQFLHERMLETVPRVENDDLVVVYTAVEGRDRKKALHRMEYSQVVRPVKVGTHRLQAIQSTTAAGLAEAARFLLKTGRTGVVLQTDIPTDQFLLEGPFVCALYGLDVETLAAVGR
ncbi:MAG TPA: saccharopine dehydrogenase C-terminal domain-containing protein [Thermoanaerobaculia bacterium]|nr:saccharopine dehydrogenase C-terminal domain-containing protein [Thermoanaerobaculia bacterium]